MQRVSVWLLTRTGRVVLATAGLMTLLALQPESVRFAQSASAPSAMSASAARTLRRPVVPAAALPDRRYNVWRPGRVDQPRYGAAAAAAHGSEQAGERGPRASARQPRARGFGEPHGDRRLAWHHRRAGVYHPM